MQFSLLYSFSFRKELGRVQLCVSCVGFRQAGALTTSDFLYSGLTFPDTASSVAVPLDMVVDIASTSGAHPPPHPTPIPSVSSFMLVTRTSQRLSAYEKTTTCTNCLGLQTDCDSPLILLNVVFLN